MYVIHLKKIYLVVCCILIATIALCQISMEKPETVQTVALPINNKVIVLDAGYVGEDE